MKLTMLGTLLSLLLGAGIGVGPSEPHLISDPMFGIDYDTDKVLFEPMPALVKDQCPQMRNHYARAWVYGHLKTKQAEYFVVSGYIKVESENNPGVFTIEPEEGDGFVIELRPGNCLVDPSPYVFFPSEAFQGKKPNPTIHVPDAVLEEISAELLQRYAKAFGGKNDFLRRIRNVKRDDLPASLRNQLSKFEKARVRQSR